MVPTITATINERTSMSRLKINCSRLGVSFFTLIASVVLITLTILFALVVLAFFRKLSFELNVSADLFFYLKNKDTDFFLYRNEYMSNEHVIDANNCS